MKWQRSRCVLTSGFAASRLAPQAQAGDDVRVTLRRGLLEIVEQLAALIDHLQQSTAGRVIALVRAEMLTETIDAGGQQCDLHFRRAGIVGVAAVLGDDSALIFSRQ